ncbi:MAG: arylsulfatase [Acidobacteria bacterium]|nr:arylsulfatase [Acidobacteriota bacterium]
MLADDLGYGDVGCFGQKLIETPNLDRLAAEGLRFTNAYAGAAVCAPSRCCLMTGLDTGHGRIRNNKSAAGERVSLRPEDVTVAEVLKRAGYRTAAIGKWGLGEAGSRGVPNAQGFDDWYGFLNQDHALDYYPRHLWENEREVFPDGNQGARQKEYVQELFTRRALSFLDARGRDPFFLYLAYTVPHASSELGRDTGDGYPVPGYGPYAGRDWPRPEKGYAAMVGMLDSDVGRVMEKLRSLGVERDTLVVFASDNGATTEGGHSPSFFGSGGGFRGAKGTLYEGGIRTPAIARWPGRVKAGTVCDAPWAFWDFLPTAAELAGVEAPRGLDGVSIAPLLQGAAELPREALYWEAHGKKEFRQAVRMGRWKGLRARGGAGELYDLAVDPGERENLWAARPEVAARIVSVMERARSDSEEYPVAR